MASPKQGSWWGRNWKWFVPTICVVALIIFGGFLGALFFGINKLLRSSDAYKIAVATAKADPRVTAALGAPITEGMFVKGSIFVSSSSQGGSTGRAKLAIPVSGPKGEATIYVAATKTAGKWSFSKLVVQVKGTQESIDLNEKRKLSKVGGPSPQQKPGIYPGCIRDVLRHRFPNGLTVEPGV